jgi:tRNA A-37 threonylcarbamoyl transferase component Bud32
MAETAGQRPHGAAAGTAPAVIRTCFDAALVRAFAAGELDARALQAVDTHLDECPTCRGLVVAALASPGAASSRPELAPGRLLADRYRIVRFIGRGGMGEIYEAQDEVLHERVALKCLTPALADNPKGVEYLKSEAQLARKVGHPNVCRVYDVGVDTSSGSTRFFLSMELLSGRPLSRAIARGALPLPLVASIAEQLLLGLREAHRAGVLHRDFKSDNVLFRSDDESSSACQVAITDFGLSRLVSEDRSHVTTSTMCVGSAAYMAPEQVEGGRLAQTTDIYSFGVVVFEMLTGTLPFLSETALATAVLRLRAPAPRVRARAPQLPQAWDDFVARCLERAPGRRFPSADAALHALERLAPVEQAARPRSRAWALGLGAGALAVATYWSIPREHPALERGSQRTALPAGAPATGARPPALPGTAHTTSAAGSQPSAEARARTADRLERKATDVEACGVPDGSIDGACLPLGAVPNFPSQPPARAPRPRPERTTQPAAATPEPSPSAGESAPARAPAPTNVNESRHPRFDRLVDPFR